MKTPITRLYFAYGSNMDQERLESRVGPVVKHGVVTLPFWELNFECGPLHKRFANMVMTGESHSYVEGVMYEMSIKQMKILDSYEGFPLFYQKLSIPLRDGRTMYAYVSLNPNYRSAEGVMCTPDYIEFITKGCTDNHLFRTMKRLKELEKEGYFTLP